MKMTKQELISAVARKTTQYKIMYTKREVEEILDPILASILEALQNGESVSFKHFGKFSVKTRPAHWARNPKTSERCWAPEKRSVEFTLSPSVDLAKIKEPETLCELLSDEDMENIFQFKEEKQNETV